MLVCTVQYMYVQVHTVTSMYGLMQTHMQRAGYYCIVLRNYLYLYIQYRTYPYLYYCTWDKVYKKLYVAQRRDIK